MIILWIRKLLCIILHNSMTSIKDASFSCFECNYRLEKVVKPYTKEQELSKLRSPKELNIYE